MRILHSVFAAYPHAICANRRKHGPMLDNSSSGMIPCNHSKRHGTRRTQAPTAPGPMVRGQPGSQAPRASADTHSAAGDTPADRTQKSGPRPPPGPPGH